MMVSGLLFFGMVSAFSVFLGGLISIIPNAYFAFKVFRYRGARSTELLVRSAYTGELVKLALTGAGFALVFTQIDPLLLHIAGLFCGFITVYLAGLVGMAVVFRR